MDLLGTQYTYGEAVRTGSPLTIEGVRFDATDALHKLPTGTMVDIVLEVRGHDGRVRRDEVIVLDAVRFASA